MCICLHVAAIFIFNDLKLQAYLVQYSLISQFPRTWLSCDEVWRLSYRVSQNKVDWFFFEDIFAPTHPILEFFLPERCCQEENFKLCLSSVGPV